MGKNSNQNTLDQFKQPTQTIPKKREKKMLQKKSQAQNTIFSPGQINLQDKLQGLSQVSELTGSSSKSKQQAQVQQENIDQKMLDAQPDGQTGAAPTGLGESRELDERVQLVED